MNGFRARALSAALVAIVVGACADAAQAPGIERIAEDDLRADLFALSHDSMQGRLVGTPSLYQASDWIAERFEEAGLEPAGDDGDYRQRFDLAWFSLGAGDNRLGVRGSAGDRAERGPGAGWTPSNVSSTGRAVGRVVFAGFGIVEPRLGYDDYGDDGAGRVAGRIVLVLEREPGVSDPSSPFDGVVTTEASREWRKAIAAQERGAIGIFFVRDVHNRDDVGDWQAAHRGSWPDQPRRIERFTLSDWVERVEIPAARISVELAELLVSGSGRTLLELAREAEAATDGLGVIELPDARAQISTSVERHVTEGMNVLAMIEGSDPELQDEVVIIGAHHDHNGMTEEAVFNGADDDGSGTVGVIAVAEAYARAAEDGIRPRRSVIFGIWDAEERGLLGAWYYTLRPLFPLPRTAAKLNLDMIGRHEEVPPNGGGRFRGLEVQSAESNANAINILGYSRTPELAAAVDSANSRLADAGAIAEPLTLRFRYDNNASNLLRRSDHWPFLQNDVPAVWFHTGLHPDYHTPDDDPERVEYEKMTRIVRLVYQTSWDIANADGTPSLEPMGVRPPS